MNNWTPQTIKSWTAGIIDGEGYVTIQKCTKGRYGRRDYLTTKIRVGNTDMKMVDMLQLVWGGNVRFRKRGGNRRDIYEWDIQCTQARRVLESILPYSITKKKQMELAINFQKRVSNREGLHYQEGSRGVLMSEKEWNIRYEMYGQMRKLNRTGRTIEKIADIVKR